MPSLLILDEATSALDGESEAVVQAALDQLVADTKATTIIVAHRLSTIRNADKIVVLDNPDGLGAVVVQEGVHAELMKNTAGLYYKLVRSQLTASSTEALGEDSAAVEQAMKLADAGEAIQLERKMSKRRTSIENLVRTYTDKSVLLSSSSSSSSAVSPIVKNSSKRTKPQKTLSRSPSLAETLAMEDVADPKKESKASVWKKRLLSIFKKKPKTIVTDGAEELKPVSQRRVYGYLKGDFLLVLLGAVASLVAGTLFPSFGLIFARFLAVYYYDDPEKIQDESNYWAMWFVIIGVGGFFVELVKFSCFNYAGAKFVSKLRARAFSNLMYQEISFFDHPVYNPAALASTLSADVALVQGGTTANLAVGIQAMSALVTGVVIAFLASPKLAAIVLAMFFILVPAGAIEGKFMMTDDMAQNADALDDVTTPGYVMSETLSGIRVVASFGLERFMLSRYCALIDASSRKKKRNAFLLGFFWGFSQGGQMAVNAVALYVGGRMVMKQSISATDMMQTVFALMFGASGAGQSVIFATDAKKAKQATLRVFHIIDRKSKLDSRDPSGKQLKKADGKIEVEQINFAYPTRPDMQIYKNLTFSAAPGERVALVGASGCGKSTIVSLLERFYDLEDSCGVTVSEAASKIGPAIFGGKIKVDGVDIKDLNLRSLRSLIGLVSQEPSLFSTSILENIRFGRPEATEKEVRESAQRAHCHEFIEAFPEKYETNVGGGGSQLSGGQKQRIAIARAILTNPSILVLDEATSALDVNSERQVQLALEELLAQQKRTTITIAHRLSTIKAADKIVVLNNEDNQGSTVEETGTHQELMTNPKGLYKQLVEINGGL
eukprot:GHVT01020504.1.p1 GENE.GHVT01020504.1~~GHVT01020504.1.p1  ORF type:complete len:837 (-),score=190.15 GHVT01020504.1:970-3480(-)